MYIASMRAKAATKKQPRDDTSSKAKKATKVKKVAAKKKSRVPLTRNNGTMSESAFWAYIRSALRNRTQFWKPRLKVLEEARRSYSGPNKKQKWEFQCAHCENWFLRTQVEVNHIVECGTLTCSQDLPAFVEKLFCEKEGLEVVCKDCHKKHHAKDVSI